MKVKTNLSLGELGRIATILGLVLFYPEKRGNYFKFRLIHDRSVTKKSKYVRVGFSGRKVNSACLHGYTMFMLEVLKRDAEACFKSSMYNDKVTIKNISKVYDFLYGMNIGSIMNPYLYGDACSCSYEDRIELEDNLARIGGFVWQN